MDAVFNSYYKIGIIFGGMVWLWVSFRYEKPLDWGVGFGSIIATLVCLKIGSYSIVKFRSYMIDSPDRVDANELVSGGVTGILVLYFSWWLISLLF